MGRSSGFGRFSHRVCCNSFGMIDVVYIEVVERSFVSCEVVEVVPSHRVDVRLGDLLSKLRLSLRKEPKDTPISKETVLLYDLGVDTRRT